MSKHFAFLEIADPEIDSLLWQIRDALGVRVEWSPIHVTIRGPYQHPITAAELEVWREMMGPAPLTIGPFDVLHHSGRWALIARIHHPRLELLWDKPDFPVSVYGFNPHITLYEGDSESAAHRACDFLNRENIVLSTTNYVLTTFLSKQRDLFRSIEPATRNLIGLVRTGRVHPTFLFRFESFVRNGFRLDDAC